VKSILIVDDDPLVLSALLRVVRSCEFDIYSASSGEQALRIMREQTIHLVLSDYLMPNMLGTQLLAKIAVKWPETQRLIISGHSDYKTVLKAIQSGVVHKFLAKPWSNNELLEQIDIALKQVLEQPPVSAKKMLVSEHHVLNQGIHLQAILNTVRDGIVTYNKSGVILSVNQALLSCFNYIESDLIGVNLVQVIPDIEISEKIQASAKLVGRKKTGEVFPLEFTCSDMSTQGFDHQLGVIRDITDWAVRETENKQLLAALDSCQDSYALFSASGHLIRCNQKFQEMYADCEKGPVVGVSYREFLEDCIASGLFPEARESAELFIDVLLQADVQPSEQQYKLGRNKWIQIHQTRADNDCVISFHIDVSQSKRSQLLLQNALTEAQHANSARGRFLAMMSHEIRTPLNAVLGLLQVLRDTPLSEQQLEYIVTAESSGRSLLNIITDILDYSKIEANKLSIHEQSCSLIELCHSIADMIRTVNDNDQVALVLDFDKKIDTQVLVDSHRLRQILVNLLANSMKFTRRGQVMFKVTKSVDDCYHFSVRDTGIGIPLNQQQSIFDEFTQAGNNGQTGTGLGLAICRRLVVLLGGELSFESEENIGSCFWFDLTLAHCEPPKTEKKHFKFDAGQQVLLVDDSETNRIVAGEVLKNHGLSVSYAADGPAAIAACKEQQYALLLMDISMPKMDGVSATKVIRKIAHYKTLPVIALTAYAMEDEKIRFLNNGMNDVIEKPFEKTVMLNTLAKYLKTHPEKLPAKTNTPANNIKTADSIACMIKSEALDKLALDTSEELLVTLVTVFTNDLNERIKDLQKMMLQGGISAEDLACIERHFHTIASSSAIYGLQRLSASALVLEHQLKAQTQTAGENMKPDISVFCQLAGQSLQLLAQLIEERVAV